jgi:hypothetical protein
VGIAVFNPVAFKARYPEFAAVSNDVLTALFLEAGLYLDNSDCSPVQDLTRRGMFLNMITAHIAFLGGLLSADGQPRPVGRVSQAGEGTVSASFDWNQLTPGSGPWFAQSQYGSAFWAATTSLRGMRYIPRPTRIW